MKNINSLKNSSQFGKVYKSGKSLANENLVMYVLPAGEDIRLGISVSKKVGNSVIRHRITRLIRESFLSLRGSIGQNCDIVVVARAASREKSEPEIERSFRNLLKRHGLVNDHD